MFPTLAVVFAMVFVFQQSMREVGQLHDHFGQLAPSEETCPEFPPCCAMRNSEGTMFLTFWENEGKAWNKVDLHEKVQIEKLSGNSTKTPEDSFKGKYGLKVNGLWVSAEKGKTLITANRPEQDTWEAFNIDWSADGNTVSIKTFHDTFFALEKKDSKWVLEHKALEPKEEPHQFELMSRNCNFDK